MNDSSRFVAVALSFVVSCSRPTTKVAVAEAPRYPEARAEPAKVEATALPSSEPAATPSSPRDGEPAPAPRAHPAMPCEDCLLHLDRFSLALGELGSGYRDSNVRILWLGDSHTAADFLTDQVRRDLAFEFPSGGPGYVPIGQKGLRHGAVSFESTGRWKRQPRDPATQLPTSDGVFGYGGYRTLPGTGATARITPRHGAVGRADLAYRLRPGDALEIRFGTQTKRLTGRADRARIEHTTLTLDPTEERASLSIRQLSGEPELFGVDLTTLKPGLVLDTVGINGARLGTALAWNREAFEAEVAVRNPELVVLMYGTNEVFDRRDPQIYEENALELVSRVRAAAPHADCWIIGPPDARTPTGESRERVELINEAERRAAERAGCAFTSLFALMGGRGSFSAWVQASPQLARPDNIHLTVLGYEELGRRLSKLLLRSIHERAIPEAPPPEPLYSARGGSSPARGAAARPP